MVWRGCSVARLFHKAGQVRCVNRSWDTTMHWTVRRTCGGTAPSDRRVFRRSLPPLRGGLVLASLRNSLFAIAAVRPHSTRIVKALARELRGFRARQGRRLGRRDARAGARAGLRHHRFVAPADQTLLHHAYIGHAGAVTALLCGSEATRSPHETADQLRAHRPYAARALEIARAPSRALLDVRHG